MSRVNYNYICPSQILSRMIDTLIFDFDGVIADSEDIWDKGQTEFLRRKGFVYNRAKTKHLMTGKSLVDGVKVMQGIYGFSGYPIRMKKLI